MIKITVVGGIFEKKKKRTEIQVVQLGPKKRDWAGVQVSFLAKCMS